MNPYDDFISVSIYKGGIVAITSRGQIWQWVRSYDGQWCWRSIAYLPE